MRLYAVGDIHGCLAALTRLNAMIAEDLKDRPAARHAVIHLGDYVDRGPDSAGVLDYLAERARTDRNAFFLRGNHDSLLMEFLEIPEEVAPTYLTYGGRDTLRSYGCRAGLFRRPAAIAAEAREMIPAHHLAFLAETRLSLRLGDYVFCHAGIRPGVPLDDQEAEDLIWIREPFLLDDTDHGVVVVHGHTPVTRPEVRSNRINVDTGAVFGGALTAVVLEGTGHRFLSVNQADL